MFTLHGTFRSFMSGVAAGFPSPAEGCEDERLHVHTWLVRNEAATFPWTVEGDELEAEHICHGTVVLVDRSLDPTQGMFILARNDHGFQVRRFRKTDRVQVIGVIIAAIMRF